MSAFRRIGAERRAAGRVGTPLSVPVVPIAQAFLLCAAIGCVGCTASDLPPFRLNTEGRDPEALTGTQTEAIEDALQTLFGTPEEPAAPPEAGLRLDPLMRAAGPIRGDAEGNQRGLYRQHCAICHGISGDGAGSLAAVMYPYPRDFRNGVYKYTSTAGGAMPVRDDLDRIVRRGMPGTSMPSFATLPEEQIEALVEYLRYLGLRGETELFLFQLVVDEDEYVVDLDEVLDDGLQPAVDLWAEAGRAVVAAVEPASETPQQRRASAARGYELFSSKNAQCVACHGPEGKGDGEQAGTLADDWNRRKKGATPEQTKELARRFRLPLQPLWPRNFTQGIFHGGSQPIDLYWRIHVGIQGTPMPAGGPAPGASGVLTPEEIWHVVHYIRSRAGIDDK
ncbi:MAG: cytochrome c [Pirellulales bacterium]|nr:cytochrome c [Pirellulales bacterium]